MSVAPVITQNRINPFSVPTIQQTAAPYVTYGEVALCADPNCPVCRAQRRHKHHHKRHHHKKHKTKFWDNPVVRVESASSDVSVHSVELNERRPQVTERDLVPVNQIERQVATTTTRPTEDAWTTNPSNDDEIVCCRAYDGCRCPCWCCIILIILFVILIIILIVLLATLL